MKARSNARRNAGLVNEAHVAEIKEETMVPKPEDPSEAAGDLLARIVWAKVQICMRILAQLLLPILRDARTAVVSLLVAVLWQTFVANGTQVPSVPPLTPPPLTQLA